MLLIEGGHYLPSNHLQNCTETSVLYRYSDQFSPIQLKYANLLI